MTINPQEAAQRLHEIRQRAAAIIPGPWAWMGNTETEQVHLCTTDRGRLFILYPDQRRVDRVIDHYNGEVFEIEDARAHVHSRWCTMHGAYVDHTDTGQCICDELRDFLSGDPMDPLDPRHFNRQDRGYTVDLTRATELRTDLRFAVRQGRDYYPMESYQQHAKYEVLGYRTVSEWEADQGGVVPSVGGDINDALYRKDFVGIDTPEADFIQHSAGDVAWLLSYIAELEERLHGR